MSIACWTLLSRTQALARSSHCLSVTGTGRAALYSGELKPRTPVDTDDSLKGAIHVYDVAQTRKVGVPAAKWQTVIASRQLDTATHAPEPRVGAASAAIGEVIYIWGGRGGVDMVAKKQVCGLLTSRSQRKLYGRGSKRQTRMRHHNRREAIKQ